MKINEVIEQHDPLELDEALPAIPLIIAGAKAATPFLARQGAKILTRVARRPVRSAAMGTAGVGAILGKSALEKIVDFSSKYGLPILAAVAILYGGKKVIDFLRKKGESIEETATAGGTSAGNVASGGFAIGIGTMDRAKKKKTKLIKR